MKREEFPSLHVLADPKTILGIGAKKHTLCAREIYALVQDFLEENHIKKVHLIASAVKFEKDACFQALACWLQAPCCFFTYNVLEAQTAYIPNPSQRVYEKIGCHSVAEAAAFAASAKPCFFIKEKTVKLPLTLALVREKA